MTQQKLEGKVAVIVSERELVINIGSRDNVLEGMKFKIMADQPVIVTDPVTGVELGRFEREKVRVKATRVYEKFTICRTYRVTKTYSSVANLAIGLGRDSEYETLRADNKDYIPPLEEKESFVKKGDRAILTSDDDR
ncbi:MAG: hypothetical protein M1434_13185 [Chloroflexi bacterium]|nr:hypothetical protein [Chloroflexota bacterium]MCL5275676.1 hypothetical protein [Chloroflexota bacterium]